LTVVESLGKVDEYCRVIALVFERSSAVEDLVDLQCVAQIELDATVIPEHAEANRVLSLNGFLSRIDADVEVVIKKIVVGAIRSVSAAQHFEARRNRSPGIDRSNARLRFFGRSGGSLVRLLSKGRD